MKHFCCRCETYMEYESHESVSEGSVGIFFKCAQCGNRIALITNPGETMLVHSLGVKIGGSELSPEPLELTRSTLKEGASTGEEGSLKWSPGARARVQKIPLFVRPMAMQSISEYALQKGYPEITEQVIDKYKTATNES